MVTDNAHLISLNRFTGELGWETEIAGWRLNYTATSAPLAVDGLAVSGNGRRRGRKDDWKEYLHDEPYWKTCPNLP